MLSTLTDSFLWWAIFTTYFNLSPALLVPIISIGLVRWRLVSNLVCELLMGKTIRPNPSLSRPRDSRQAASVWPACPAAALNPPSGENGDGELEATSNTAEIYQPPQRYRKHNEFAGQR